MYIFHSNYEAIIKKKKKTLGISFLNWISVLHRQQSLYILATLVKIFLNVTFSSMYEGPELSHSDRLNSCSQESLWRCRLGRQGLTLTKGFQNCWLNSCSWSFKKRSTKMFQTWRSPSRADSVSKVVTFTWFHIFQWYQH